MGAKQTWPRRDLTAAAKRSRSPTPWGYSLHSVHNDIWIGSELFPTHFQVKEDLSVVPGDLYQIEDTSGRKRRPFPTERSIQPLFCCPEGFDVVIDDHTWSICQISSCGLAAWKVKRKKKSQICPHFHQSMRSRMRWSWNLSTFSHYVMWNIAPLLHMPQQICCEDCSSDRRGKQYESVT